MTSPDPIDLAGRLVEKVAELHGSTVQVASRPGAGSVFTVVLQAA